LNVATHWIDTMNPSTRTPDIKRKILKLNPHFMMR